VTEEMKIVFMKDQREKILEKELSPPGNHAGIISLQATKKEIEFTVRIQDINHIHYSFDPETQKFEVQFLSLMEPDGKS
jgi:hypothetical protein